VNKSVVSLKKELIDEIVKLIREEIDVDKIVIFGSSVREDNRRISDIDIALFGVKEKSALLKTKLNEEIRTLKDIDVIFFDELKNDEIKKRILDEGIVIYEKNS